MENELYNGSYQETIFYLGNCISKEFELEKECLYLDSYYNSIVELTSDYIKKGYGKKNMGLLSSINEYINDYKTEILIVLRKNYVVDNERWY